MYVHVDAYDNSAFAESLFYQMTKKTYVGPGKLQELFEAVQAASASVVIVDADLSPRQLRALEAEMAYRCSHQAREQSAGQSRLQAPPRVLDRTSVILDIFAKHAR
jgi:GTP-binding protein HflX